MGFSDKAVYKRKVLFPQREKYPFDLLVRLEFPRVVDNINKPCLILRETISLKKMARKRLMDRWGFFCYFWINQNCKCVLWIHFSNSILSTPLLLWSGERRGIAFGLSIVFSSPSWKKRREKTWRKASFVRSNLTSKSQTYESKEYTLGIFCWIFT